LVLPFWYRLTQVVLEKRPLNGCCCWWWWSLKLDTIKEKAIESCRMGKDAGSLGPIYTQYKKRNYYTKSAFAKSRLLRPVILPMIYMKLYCANLVKNFGRFGNRISPMLLPTLFRLMALLTALL